MTESIQAVYWLLGLLGLILFYVIWTQYEWGRFVDKRIKVIVVRADGEGDVQYVTRGGNTVVLQSPDKKTVRAWGFNQLAMIDTPYPASGFVPTMLQKKIRTIIVDEEDGEPLFNRNIHRNNVMSPDVADTIAALVKDPTTPPSTRDVLQSLYSNKVCSPTRELTLSPALLGNVISEKITEAAMTMSKDDLDTMKDSLKLLKTRLKDLVTPKHLLIGFGIILMVLVAAGVYAYQYMLPILDKINRLP